MVVIVDEPIADTEELIETLLPRSMIPMSPKMPLAKKGGAVPRSFENLSESHLIQSQIPTLGGVHVSLRPVVHPPTLGMPTGHDHGPRRTADHVSVGLGETNSAFGEFVDIRGLQVGSPITAGIQGPLIIGKKKHDVGFGLKEGRRQANAKRNQTQSVVLLSHWISLRAFW